MSAALAISAAASAQAAAAAAQAAAARRVACNAMLPNYNAQTATVAEMRDYAGCVEFLHPQPMDATGILVAKIAFVIALSGLPLGAWYGKACWGDWGDALMFALLGFLLVPIAVGFVVGILAGIVWLFA